jgi:hypothetical protein
MDRQFPIGKFQRPAVPLGAATRAGLIGDLERMPADLRAVVGRATDAQLGTPYRPGGWTVRQVVHHVPESHMNAYVRFKLALTEDAPTIKPYMEDRWSELPDVALAPPSLSLDLLDAIHRRWVLLLRALPASEFQRTYVHPDLGVVPLDAALALYAWHGKHHIAHVTLVVGS